MKRILRRAKSVPERAEFYCDFTRRKLGPAAPIYLDIWFGYGSDRDGATYRMHLSNGAAAELMAYLRLRLYPRKMRTCGHDDFFGESDIGPAGTTQCVGPEDQLNRRQLKAEVARQVDGGESVG